MDPVVTITSARVSTADGREAALIATVDVGGGEQVVTVDGIRETRVHASSRVYHVRLISPDRMVADQLLEASSYEEACGLGAAYAVKLAEHAARADELASDLRM
jgi:hypothetical protein